MFAGVLQEYLKLRSQHVASLKAAGESPYPHKFQVTISLTDFIEKYENIDAGQTLPDLVSVAGRLISSRCSYWPPTKLLAQTFLQEYTFILYKTGTLYNNIFLFIFRTLK